MIIKKSNLNDFSNDEIKSVIEVWSSWECATEQPFQMWIDNLNLELIQRERNNKIQKIKSNLDLDI